MYQTAAIYITIILFDTVQGKEILNTKHNELNSAIFPLWHESSRCRRCQSNLPAIRWVYTFDAVKRFDTLSYASQMRIKAFCGVSVYTFHAGISARQRARESVARRKMLQSSTLLNFHALRQRTQAIQPIIYRCHELSLQRIDLAITSESSHWTISSWRRSRKAHLIAIKVQS